MTTVTVSGPSPRKKIFDITVVPGTPQTIRPSSLHFDIVAKIVTTAGAYTIEQALTEELSDWRPLKNSAAVDNTALANDGTVGARTSTVVPPGAQLLKFTATTTSTRFVAYGI